jgi:type II secretory pathway predicted ATPase ExeA
MTSSDLTSFGLRSSPFSKEIDDGDLWLPESKATLVADIEEALADRQSVICSVSPASAKRACCARCGKNCRNRASA